MDPTFALIKQAKPPTSPPTDAARARQRQALAATISVTGGRPRSRSLARSLRTSMAVAAITAAAVAAMVVAAVVAPAGTAGSRVPAVSSPPLASLGSTPTPQAVRPPVLAQTSSTTRTTAALGGRGSGVVEAAEHALADTTGDVEEDQTTAGGTTLVSWFDVGTGAYRADSGAPGRQLQTRYLSGGIETTVDYPARQWWTSAAPDAAITPATPESIEAELAAGPYALAGEQTVDGHDTVELAAGPTAAFRSATVWVDASTYLPVQVTSVEASGQEASQIYTWSTATPQSTAVLEVSIPPGFRHLASPPTSSGAPRVG